MFVYSHDVDIIMRIITIIVKYSLFSVQMLLNKNKKKYIYINVCIPFTMFDYIVSIHASIQINMFFFFETRKERQMF